MRLDIRHPLIPGGIIKKGSGENNFAFIILETGGVCLENKLKLALENLEFILASLVPFKVGDFGSLRAPGGGYLVYLGAGSKNITTGGYYPQYHSGNSVISLDYRELQRLFYRSSNNSLTIGLGQGVGNIRR